LNKNPRQILRTGIGYDVHRFAPGRKLILGGVHIPHKTGLFGHSDADVLCHAICDALLGAAALGDIGQHFPNTSKKFKNISSLVMLKDVRRLVGKAGYEVVNVDSMVLLEEPKIARFIPTMKKNIGRALHLLVPCVSIKATTNEHLGFVGREEGCAAMAVATLISER
jgi:2-C-methyl-D-erythritol 2,4-cyclodiphosphate synthase